MSYHNRYKIKKEKFLPTFLVLILVVFIALMYVKNGSFFMLNKSSVVSTTTPKEIKPKIDTKNKLGIDILPSNVMQGEPVLIVAQGVASTTLVKSFTLNNKPLVYFTYEGKVVSLYGADLHGPTGVFKIVLTLKDGTVINKDLVIEKRPEIRRHFDIPEKLGGNTEESIKILFSTLAEEGKIMNALPTANKKLWTDYFASPLNGKLVVHDPYGYTRTTLNVSMPHKGVDLEAPIGMNVYSMNKGVVEFADNLRNYGNTVLVDHGLGLQTVYMHLSEIKVKKGDVVEKRQLIGLSGDTGYTLDPHLHLTVRIWDISIDPLKFLELFGEGN